MKKTDTDYGYYSKILGKPFDSIEELKDAEAAFLAKQKAKNENAMLKKQDANKVEKAFKAFNLAKSNFNEELLAAKTAYAKIVADAEQALHKSIAEADTKLDEAQKAYSEALKEFTDKHPEGYHVTLKDGDNVTTISRNVDKRFLNPFDIFNKCFDEVFNSWF